MKILLSMCRRNPDSQHEFNLKAVDNLREHGVPIPGPHIIQSEYLDGMSLLPWARNLNIAACLAEGADYIFILDDDVWFRREDIATAIQSQLPIVGFPVMLKTINHRNRTLNYAVLEGDDFVDADKEFRQVARIGTGAMLVKAEVFYALQKTRPYFLCDGFQSFRPELKIQENCFDYFPVGVQDLNGRPSYVGEDYGFCMEAMKVGYPTYHHNGSSTCHMVDGVEYGYLCDMLELRQRKRMGILNQGKEFNL